MRDNKLLGVSRKGGGGILQNRGESGHGEEEEKSRFIIVKEELRQGLFGGFYVLLRQSEQGAIWKFMLLYFVLLLQMLSFSFDESLGEAWQAPEVVMYVSRVLSTFRLIYWLEKANWDIFIIIYYATIFKVFFVIITFIYVAYCFRQRKFPFTWPITSLKYFSNIIVTVLFIPTLELFLKMSSCRTADPSWVTNAKQQDGTLRHSRFPEVQCFQGIHILHVTLSYVVIVVFLVITYIITCCFYESRLGKSPVAKSHSRSHIAMLASKALYVFAFTFFNSTASGDVWFLSICLFIGSAVIFSSFYLGRPYYDSYAQQIMNVYNGLFLWTNTVLLLSCFLRNLEFTGSLPIFLLGSPFIVVIVMGLRDDRKAHLMKNLNMMQSGADYQKYINFYLTIIEHKEENRDAAMTLKGYVNHHSEFCNLDDCPLKNFKKQLIKDQKKDYGQFGPQQAQLSVYNAATAIKQQVTTLESPALLISQAKNLYVNGVRKYPDCVSLRIDFSFFLLSKMLNKRDSLKELMSAEKLSTSLDESFMIYRYRQIIEDELYEGESGSYSGGSSSGMDYVAALNFENHFRAFRQMVEKSASYHYDFWQMLLDDQPDLMRLKDQGTKINLSIQQVEMLWRKLLQQSMPTVKALRLYASYLIEVLNDKDQGNDQLAKAKELGISRVGGANFDLNGGEDGELGGGFAADGSPCVYISGEQEKLGTITHCNMSMCKVFGYTKRDALIGHDVEKLMPKIYGRVHKKFLEQAIQKPADMLYSKERLVFGKHSSGYIFPVWLSIKNVPSFVTGRQFAATFKIEKSGINKNVSYLILDNQRNLLETSASAISMLELDAQRFLRLKAKVSIERHLPSLFGPNYYQYINKNGFQLDYSYPVMQSMQEANAHASRTSMHRGGNGDDNASVMDYGQEEDGGNINSAKLQLQTHGPPLNSRRSRGSTFRFNNKFSDTNVLSMMEEEEQEGLLNVQGGDQLINKTQGRSMLGVPDEGVTGMMLRQVQPGDQEVSDDDDDERDSMVNGVLKHYENVIVPHPHKVVTFQCNKADIHFETQGIENHTPGFYVRLETIPDKQTGFQKVTKSMKQASFQFSYDPVNKRFKRELRDKDNKNISDDNLYLQMKRMKEQQAHRLAEDPAYVVPPKVASLTYLTFLTRHQRWQARGCEGDVMDAQEEDENVSEEETDQEDDEDLQEIARHEDNDSHDGLRKITAAESKRMQGPLSGRELDPNGGVQRIQSRGTRKNIKDGETLQALTGDGDFKKGLQKQQTQSKEHLKNEIERMINILRKKQDVGTGVHTFRRMEPGVRTSQTAITISQEGRWEEVAYSVASLFAGRSAEASDDEKEESEEQDKARKKGPGQEDSLKNTIKSRKAFQMALTDKTMPPAIKRLNRAANILVLTIIALAVIDYSTVFKQFKDTITNYEVIESSQRRIAEIQKVAYNVRTMIMLNQGLLKNYAGFNTSGELFTDTKDGLQSSLNELYKIQNEINLNQLSLSKEHQSLLDDKSVNLYFRQEASKGTMKAIAFSLTESLLQMQSSIFSLGNMQLDDFAAEDQGGGDAGSEEVFFLMYNSFNDLLDAMKRSSDLYVEELVDRSKQKDEVSMIIFVLSIVFLCTMVAILVPVVASVNEHKSKVLMLFCEIEDSAIRKLSFKCDRFLMKLQSEENADDMDSNNEELLQMFGESNAFKNPNAQPGHEDDEDYNGGSGSGVTTERKKRAKNLMKTSLLFYLKFVAGVMIIEAYFAFNFSQIRNYAGDTNVLVSELNTTTVIEPYLWFALNVERELFYNYTKPITGGSSSFKVSMDSIYKLSQLTFKIESEHILNEAYLSETYRENFDKAMRTDTCPQQDYFPEYPIGSGSYPKCEAFSSGVATQGLNVLLIQFVKYVRVNLSQYQLLLKQTSGNFTNVRATIVNSADLSEQYLMQRHFIAPLMRKLVSDLNSSIIESLNALIQQTLFLLIFFLILLMLAYVIVWIPLVNQLNSQINKTKLMLMIVPIELLMKMKNIGKVLQSQDLIQESGAASGSQGGEPKRSRNNPSRALSSNSRNTQ